VNFAALVVELGNHSLLESVPGLHRKPLREEGFLYCYWGRPGWCQNNPHPRNSIATAHRVPLPIFVFVCTAFLLLRPQHLRKPWLLVGTVFLSCSRLEPAVNPVWNWKPSLAQHCPQDSRLR